MSLPIKTRDDILESLRTSIESLGTNLNVGDHSVPYDIGLYPASVLGHDLWLLADFTTRVRSTSGIIAILDDTNYKTELQTLFSYDSIDQVETLISSLLTALVGNWGVVRNPAQKARVLVRFYASSNSAVTIVSGSRVSSRGQSPVIYTILGGANGVTPIYDSVKSMYYVELMCEASVAGADSNVGVNSITVLLDNISGIIQCNNPAVPYVMGVDQEDDYDLATRAASVWVSWSLDTVGGIKAFFNGQPSVSDTYVARPGDPLINRNPRGTPVDIFVNSNVDPVVNVDVFLTVDSLPVQRSEKLLLNNMFGVSRSLISTPNELDVFIQNVVTSTTLTYYMNMQPVISVQSISGTSSGDISFEEHIDETHAFSGSTRSRSYVMMTIDTAVAQRGETVTVNYTYNSAIVALQNTIDNEENNLLSQDLLVRAGKSITVFVTGTVLTLQGYTRDTVLSNIVADITKLFSGGVASTGKRYSKYTLGQRVDVSDIQLVALSVDGVDRIDGWTTNINNTVVTSVYYPKNSEYAVYGGSTWLQ